MNQSAFVNNSLKPILIDAWRLASTPWRIAAHSRARSNGTVPVAILFYHRVADDEPNDWTISCSDFQDQVDWLSDNFDLVSLEEAQNRIRSGHNTKPTVSITFDDGYADNSTFALPMLIQRKIPVTYFVTTYHTLQGEPFPHDVERGVPLPANCADTLRAMAGAGVEIGGHTRNHPSLGHITDPEQLFDEVITATREMEEVIGKKIRYFAFPFGQLENLNSEVFRLVKEHGFKGICSAYGGWNEIGDDGFHMQRIHGDPQMAFLKNWLTVDPRKRKVWQTEVVNQMIRKGLANTNDNDSATDSTQ